MTSYDESIKQNPRWRDSTKAFPRESGETGMDMRDWFAGLAMQAFLTAGYQYTPTHLANVSYEAGDAMMRERENRNG
jgi:hypothetical protein